MKILYYLLLMSFTVVKLNAQGITIAKEFCENCRMYVLTDSIKYIDKMEELCNGNGKSVRVANELMTALASRCNLPELSSYTLNTYLISIAKDSLDIGFEDFKKEDNLIVESNARNMHYNSDVEFVSYRVKVTGALSLDTRDLIYIRKGKITKIDRCITEILKLP